jgi:hypothetical protein
MNCTAGEELKDGLEHVRNRGTFEGTFVFAASKSQVSDPSLLCPHTYEGEYPRSSPQLQNYSRGRLSVDDYTPLRLPARFVSRRFIFDLIVAHAPHALHYVSASFRSTMRSDHAIPMLNLTITAASRIAY